MAKDDLLASSRITGLHPTLAPEAPPRVAGPDAQDRGFADDLLRGADEIAEFLFGDRKYRRRVYHLAATSRLPLGKLGSMLVASRSALVKFFEDQFGAGRKNED
jgi:hypothetical protein